MFWLDTIELAELLPRHTLLYTHKHTVLHMCTPTHTHTHTHTLYWTLCDGEVRNWYKTAHCLTWSTCYAILGGVTHTHDTVLRKEDKEKQDTADETGGIGGREESERETHRGIGRLKKRFIIND